MDMVTRKLHDEMAAIDKRHNEITALDIAEGSVEASAVAEEAGQLAKRADEITERMGVQKRINESIARMKSAASDCAPMAVAKRSEQADASTASDGPDDNTFRPMGPRASRAAGMLLRSLARGEMTELRAAIGTSGATEEANSHGEKSPTYDGRNSELVIADFTREVMGILAHTSVAMQLCTRISTTTNRITVPRSDEDVEADLYLENCEIMPVTIKTTGMTINVEKIGARAQVSNELLEDAIVSVPQLVARKFGTAFSRKVDSLWLEGDTNAGIVGLLDAVTESVDISGKNMTPSHVAEVVAKINPYATAPVWVLSQQGIAHVMQAAASAIGKDLTQPIGMTLFGLPVYKCLTLPAGTLGFFGDIKQASMVVDRSNGLTINASRERAIEFDQTVFVGTQRLGVATVGPTYVVKLLGDAPKGS